MSTGSTDVERIIELLEAGARSEEEQAQEQYEKFVQAMVENANVILNARLNGTKEQQEQIAQQLVAAEKNARENDDSEVADYFAVLRGLLVGENVSGRIGGLVEPLKQIAGEVSQRIKNEHLR